MITKVPNSDKDLPLEEWNRLMGVMDNEGTTNFKIPFKKLTKEYGRAYIEYLRCAWAVKDGLSIEGFCRLNHCTESLLARLGLHAKNK